MPHLPTFTKDAGLDPEVTRELNVERVVRITRLQFPVSCGFILCALLVTSQAIHTGSSPWLLAVVAPVLINALYFLKVWLRFRNAPRPQRVSERAVTRLHIGITAYGILWGALLSSVLILSHETAALILLIAVGLATIAITVTYYLPVAALTFGFLCVTPPITIAGFINPEDQIAFLLLYLFGFFAVTFALNESYKVLIENIRTRVEREQLAAEAHELSQAKNRFLASMSHELRTPLNAISGYAQLVRIDTTKAAEAVNTSMDNILDASKHLLALIDEVLDIARLESGQIEYRMQTIDPAAFLDELNSIARSLIAERSLTFETYSPAQADELSRAKIDVDPLRLKQVMLNLLSNAVKYTPDGGTVSLGLQTDHMRTITLFVEDTGAGIPAGEQADVFEQFTRASNIQNQTTGTGLGLYHSRRLVSEMGGEITFISTESRGSRFSVAFPISEDVDRPREDRAARTDKSQTAHSTSNPPQILLYGGQDA